MACRRTLALLVLITMLVGALPAGMAGTGGTDSVPPYVPAVASGDDGAVMPLTSGPVKGEFIENLGQWDEGIRFVASGLGCDVAFHEDGVMYLLPSGDGLQAVKVSFAGGVPREPLATEDTGALRNYIMGSDPSGWVTGVRSYRTLVYEDVWSGIDVRYTLDGRNLKYDVIVGPDADPASARFHVDGSEGLVVGEDRLAIDLPGGAAIEDVDLVAWYEDGGPAEATFRALEGGFGFAVDKEPGRTLVIDPLVVLASTLLGGTYQDMAEQMAIAPDGDIIVAGTTQSTDYPVTAGAYDQTYYQDDLVVTKMDRNCTRVVWSTYIGGDDEDTIDGMDLDDQGNVHLTGNTDSADFPVTPGALQTSRGGAYTPDLYVLKLASDGSDLEYSTYLGGLYGETGGDVVVHGGKAYVTAQTESPDFPYGNITAKTYGGIPFVMVLSEDGSRMETIMSWYVTRSVTPAAMYVEEDGTVTIAGMGGAWDLPVTPGAYDNESNYAPRSFIIKCDPWTNETFVCTYFGKSGAYIQQIDMDAAGDLYFAGLTYNWSGGGGMELTDGAWCTTYKGSRDLFVTKMDGNASHVIYSTLVGGNSYDFAGDLAVSEGGVATLVGWCWDATGLVTSSNAVDMDNEGVYEGFVVALSEDGSSVVQSTMMGGTHGDHVTCVEVTREETLLLAGYTESKDFPVTEGAFQTEMAGNRDMFVLELAVLHPPSVPRNLTANGGDGNISLEWQYPLNDAGFAILNYTVHRNDTEGEMEIIHVTGPVSSFVDEEVEYGVYYTYRVAAFNGRGMSDLSNSATGRTVTFPDPPTNLTGLVLHDHIKLTWRTPLFTGGQPLGKYNLYRSVEDGPLQLMATVSPLLVSFADTAVEDRLTYTYVLASTNDHGESRENPSITLRMTGVPTPPLFLNHTYGERFIEINWSEPLEDYDLPVVRYHVYRWSATETAKLVGVVNHPGLALRDRGVEVGVVYSYHVMAENAKGMSDPSESVDAMTTIRPDAPRDVEATAMELFVRITWRGPAFDGASPVTSYRVYNVDEEGTPLHLGDVNVEGVEGPRLVFLHGVAYDGVSRRYHVTAVNVEGESDPSEDAWTMLFQVPSRPTRPGAEWGDGRVDLEWTLPSDDGGTPVTSHTLFRRISGADGFVELASMPSSTFRYLDDTVANGVEYDYWVTAWNLAGESEPSEAVTVMPAGPPSVPRQVTTEGLNGSVMVRWEEVEWDGGLPVTGYRVFGISDGMQAELLAELDADTLEFHQGDLVNGMVYLYAVQAFSMAGNSELSQIAEGRPAGAPSAPQAMIAVWMDGMVYVTWSSPMDDGGAVVTGYRIHREDWGAGNWTDVPGLGLMYSDEDVMHNTTYNYSLYAINDVGPGPVVRISFTVPPPEESTDDDAMDIWPWLLVAASVAVLGAAYFYWRRPQAMDYQVEEEE